MANYPVIAFIYTYPPDNQANSRKDGSRICQPDSHLGLLGVIVSVGQLDDNPVTKAAGAKDFGYQCADNQAEVEQTIQQVSGRVKVSKKDRRLTLGSQESR